MGGAIGRYGERRTRAILGLDRNITLSYFTNSISFS
jgi:hypothetical protein